MEVNDKAHHYYTDYIKHSRAVGVMWGIFTICYAIINIVVFLQPQWIGDRRNVAGAYYVGLYDWCEVTTTSVGSQLCTSKVDRFDTIIDPAFKAAAFFIGFSAIMILLTIVMFVLFIFIRPGPVFVACGVVQSVATMCMFLGCVIFPAGWDNSTIKGICGAESGQYHLGDCEMRWAYILAIIGIFDCLFLAILAFVLACTQPKSLKKYIGANGIVRSDNGYMVETESKPSMIIQPVMTVPGGADAYSEYSHASNKRSKKEDFSL